MINSIILTNNIHFIKNILENVDPDISCRIMTSISEIRHGLIGNEIDLIFLDDNLNKNFKDAILHLCGDFTILLKLKEDFKDGVLNPTIQSKLQKIVERNQKEVIRNRVLLELQYLGFSIKHQGTYFMLEIILEILNQEDDISYNLSSDILPTLAEKHGKKADNIRRSVISATEQMYFSCDVERMKKYFYFHDDTRPTPKDVIYAVVNKFIRV